MRLVSAIVRSEKTDGDSGTPKIDCISFPITFAVRTGRTDGESESGISIGSEDPASDSIRSFDTSSHEMGNTDCR